jgi:shikimate dehydrogenase
MIDGATRLLVIIGDPIAQVRSPIACNALLQEAGRNAVLVPWHAYPAAFDTVMAGLMQTQNLDGIVVTYPFKQRALALVDHVGRMAACGGAANALRREPDGSWTGEMFDGLGLVRAVADTGQSIAGRRVKLLGAGGAGSAIAYAVAEAGAAALSIYDTNKDRSAALAEGLAREYPKCPLDVGSPDLGPADLLINATPVGLGDDDGLPVPLPTLTAATTVFDIVPRATGTRLLALARSLGCPHMAGAAMVEGQARALLTYFGMVPDT